MGIYGQTYMIAFYSNRGSPEGNSNEILGTLARKVAVLAGFEKLSEAWPAMELNIPCQDGNCWNQGQRGA